MKFLTISTLFLSLCLILKMVNSYENEDNAAEEKDEEFEYEEESNEDEVPRVKIKVFRGPMAEENGELFAPWGYWIKQPSFK